MSYRDSFEGKVAVITGGGSGFGRATAMRLADYGASIGVADIDEKRAQSVSDEIEKQGGHAVAIKCDVAQEAQCETMVNQVVKSFDRVDMLFTSAGIHGGGSTVVDTPVETWERVIGIDLKGVYLSARYAIPQMRRQGGGSIVTVSSIHGLTGVASGMPFQAAKGGLINLTRHMAIAHAQENIRINCICPGVVKTPLTESWLSDPKRLAKAQSLHPMGRIGKIEEIASVVVFLLSDEASFMTGAIIPVDGGFMAGDRREPRGV